MVGRFVFNSGVEYIMAEEPAGRRLRQKRSSTKAKLRLRAKLQKIVWISSLVAIAIAIVAVFARYKMLSMN